MTIDESISPAPPRHIDAGGFLLFAWDVADQEGGWHDFVGRYRDLNDARNAIACDRHAPEWRAHVVLGDQIITSWDGMLWR